MSSKVKFACGFWKCDIDFPFVFHHRLPGTANHVKGVSRCDAKTPNFNPQPSPHFLTDCFQIRYEWLRHGDNQKCKVWFRWDKRWRPHAVVLYTGTVTFFSFFLFFSGSRLGHTDWPIFAQKHSNDAVWRKEVPFGGRNLKFLKFRGVLPQKVFKKGRG